MKNSTLRAILHHKIFPNSLVLKNFFNQLHTKQTYATVKDPQLASILLSTLEKRNGEYPSKNEI